MISLLVPAFKHILEKLYSSLPVTVITLIVRVGLSNAVLGHTGLFGPLITGRKNRDGGREGGSSSILKIIRDVRLILVVNQREGISTSNIFVLLEKSDKICQFRIHLQILSYFA